ncbi:GNAT family N-acetyltransferase [Kribbella lupini]|uniref:N-acetyltransferase domain-containing protein n=1 Tax=Kribbella lupini TaxID=291602 RepID=A0ABN2BW23_9ACTN
MRIQAIEANTAELLLRMGTAGGGVRRNDAKAQWTIGGSPLDYHNAVVAADLSAEEADEVIAESLALMKAQGVPGTWHVGPSMRPGDLRERLVAGGFAYDGREPAMAVEIGKLSRAELGPPELEIARVSTDEEMAVWEETLGRGFGEGPPEAAWVAEIFRREGYDDPWRHYLARLDGKPVATATIFLTEDVAGVYFVMTVPEARRKGIGGAITQYAVRAAGEAESLPAAGEAESPRAGRSAARYAVLGASSAGQPVYERLGFVALGGIELYAFHW